MTISNEKPTAGNVDHVVVVPNSVNMVSVLGPGDEYLGLIEKAFYVVRRAS